MKCTCPNCSHEFDAQIVAKMPSEQGFSMTLSPEPGMLMSPRAVGAKMAAIERIFVASSKANGFKAAVAIRKLETKEDGSVCVDMILTNAPIALLIK